jgi:DNA-binding transcriptional MerR regulator
MSKKRATESQPGSYSLRQVVELTGISEFTLRGWENRYEAFEPPRTQTGRRLYSSNDVLRAKALLDLTRQGHRIGAIAKLSLRELQDLQNQAQKPSKNETAAVKMGDGTSTLTSIGKNLNNKKLAQDIERFVQCVHRFEWREVQTTLRAHLRTAANNTDSLKGYDQFVQELVLPLISQINHLVMLGKISISQEHIFSALIKESLYAVRAAQNQSRSRWRYVFATPEGDFHEIGILVAASLTSIRGKSNLFLGPNVPTRDLCDTCLQFRANRLVLSSTISKKEGAKEDILKTVHFLDRQLPPDVEIWVAGRNTQNLAVNLKREFRVFHSFQEFIGSLD